MAVGTVCYQIVVRWFVVDIEVAVYSRTMVAHGITFKRTCTVPFHSVSIYFICYVVVIVIMHLEHHFSFLMGIVLAKWLRWLCVLFIKWMDSVTFCLNTGHTTYNVHNSVECTQSDDVAEAHLSNGNHIRPVQCLLNIQYPNQMDVTKTENTATHTKHTKHPKQTQSVDLWTN